MSFLDVYKECKVKFFPQFLLVEGFCDVFSKISKSTTNLAEFLLKLRSDKHLMCEMYKFEEREEFVEVKKKIFDCIPHSNDFDSSNISLVEAKTKIDNELQMGLFNGCGYKINEIGDFTEVPYKPTKLEACSESEISETKSKVEKGSCLNNYDQEISCIGIIEDNN